MHDKPKVSIICITYNQELYIKSAIEGFLCQKTSFPIEIWIHDDASTDGTQKIILDYSQKYPTLIKPIIQKVNQFSQNRKITPIVFPYCMGKYIALCEGDDYWTDPYKLQKQVDFLEDNPKYAGAFHETQVINDINGELKGVYGKYAPNTVYARDTFSSSALFHTSSFLFQANSVDFPDWFCSVFSGDMALFSIISASGPLKKIPGVMSVYRHHAGGMTKTKMAQEKIHEQRIYLMNHLNRYHEFKYEKQAKKIIKKHEKAIQKGVTNDSIISKIRNQLGLRTKWKYIYQSIFE